MPADEDDRERQRQVGEAALDRAVAEHLLHVQGDEEEHREQRRAHEQADDVRAGERAQPEDPERARAARRERSSIATKAASSAADSASRPIVCADPQPGVGRVDERVDEDRQAGGDGDRARRRRSGGSASVERLSAISDGASAAAPSADRDVHPQHPLPAERVGEDAAEQHAGRAAAAGDRAPDARAPCCARRRRGTSS